jgi:hypothetical protein
VSNKPERVICGLESWIGCHISTNSSLECRCYCVASMAVAQPKVVRYVVKFRSRITKRLK